MIVLSDAPSLIRTPRLDLVVSDVDFAEEFAAAMAASHGALEWTPEWREAADVAVAAASLQRSLELADQHVVRHAFLRSNRGYVGRLDLHSWDDTRCEISYVGNAEFAGQGLMREAALAMLDLAWDLGARRVQALVDSRNHRSVKFAMDIGLSREGLLRNYERDHDGQLCDQVILAAVR